MCIRDSSYYDPESMRVENEVFVRANGFKLGDVAQSMLIHNGVGWVVVNNSGVIFAIDPDTFREIGRDVYKRQPLRNQTGAPFDELVVGELHIDHAVAAHVSQAGAYRGEIR